MNKNKMKRNFLDPFPNNFVVNIIYFVSFVELDSFKYDLYSTVGQI